MVKTVHSICMVVSHSRELAGSQAWMRAGSPAQLGSLK